MNQQTGWKKLKRCDLSVLSFLNGSSWLTVKERGEVLQFSKEVPATEKTRLSGGMQASSSV